MRAAKLLIRKGLQVAAGGTIMSAWRGCARTRSPGYAASPSLPPAGIVGYAPKGTWDTVPRFAEFTPSLRQRARVCEVNEDPITIGAFQDAHIPAAGVSRANRLLQETGAPIYSSRSISIS